ncbi:hypothetical protein [Paenibacillus qinlingensis]|uniref:hypothetical protein n=1 Tax=Paenibacillus qinlingensis TaxID=1837343 RepID=UPI001FE8036D|nr:hypothetical protein [Paenibacillus qinlingensis]
MNITPQEENMIKALREAALPPLFVLIRIRNDISNDTVNVEEGRREEVVNTLEKFIAPYGKIIIKIGNETAAEG